MTDVTAEAAAAEAEREGHMGAEFARPVTPPASEQPVPAVDIAPAQAEAPAAVTVSPQRLDQVVSAWLSGHIFNSPLSQDTAAYAHLVGALPALKTAILKGE